MKTASAATIRTLLETLSGSRDDIRAEIFTNFKQRVRKMMEYYHADRLNFAVYRDQAPRILLALSLLKRLQSSRAAALASRLAFAGERMVDDFAILTGREKGKTRESCLMGLADGSIQILVGTHAIFQQAVSYRKLGLAVIDGHARGIATDNLPGMALAAQITGTARESYALAFEHINSDDAAEMALERVSEPGGMHRQS